jgi:glycosyltransferase involved in cell wall biosynthesis
MLRGRDMKKKLVIIGRVFSGKKGVNGPSSVIVSLVNELRRKNVNFELLAYDTEKLSKFKYIKMLFKKVLFKRNLIVNVHTEGFLLPFIVYLISIINPSHEYYLTIHGIYIIQTKFTNVNIKPIIKLQERILINNFPNIICVSEMLKSDIERHFGRRERVFVVNNGVYIKQTEFKTSSIEDNKINLILTGGVKKIKGVFETLEVVQYINNKADNINTYLKVYGDCDDEHTLIEFDSAVAYMKLKEYVSYEGIIKDKNQLYEKYEKAQLNMCLSHYDTFNSAILESMAVGTPTIASTNCGASYLLHNNEDGFVIDMNETYKERIYEIIKEYVCNEESFNIIRKNAYLAAGKYSWEQAVEVYLNIIFE